MPYIAFPNVTITDSGVGADEAALGGAWTEATTWWGPNTSIVRENNQFRSRAGDAFAASMRTAAVGNTANSDIEQEIELATLSTVLDDRVSLELYMQNLATSATPSGYGLDVKKDASGYSFGLARFDAGTGVFLHGVAGVALAAGDSIGLRRAGSILQGFKRSGGVTTPIVAAIDGTHMGPTWYLLMTLIDTGAGAGTWRLVNYRGNAIQNFTYYGTYDWQYGDDYFTEPIFFPGSGGITPTFYSYEENGDPENPKHPEVVAAEGVIIENSKLVFNEGAAGYSGDWQTIGIWFGPTYINTISGKEGEIRGRYVVDAQALADGTFWPLMSAVAPTPGGYHDVFSISIDTDDPGAEFLELHLDNPAIGPSFFWTTPFTPVAGQVLDVRLQWKTGTIGSGTVPFKGRNNDGFLKVFINGALVMEQLNIPVWTSQETDDAVLQHVWYGYFGLIGPLDRVFFGKVSNVIYDDPCCPGGGGGGGPHDDPDDPGNPGVKQPRRFPDPQPDWQAQCAGGINFLSAPDVTPPEYWGGVSVILLP